MKVRFLTAFGGALVLASACGEPAAPAIVAPVQTASASAPEPVSTPAKPAPPLATALSPTASAPVASAEPQPTPALAPPMGPDCKTINDCWMDDDRKPITRPAKFRGKVIRPCKDGEHAPACADGVCIVRHFKC